MLNGFKLCICESLFCVNPPVCSQVEPRQSHGGGVRGAANPHSILQTKQNETICAEDEFPTHIPNTELVKLEVKELKEMLEFMGLDGGRQEISADQTSSGFLGRRLQGRTREAG